MCGRITVTNVTPEVIQQAFDLPDAPSAALTPRYNVAPSQEIMVVAHNAHNQNALGWMKWGLVPSWAKDASIGHKMINARAETVHEKPSFRAAFKRRRCLIVADGFYEWHKEADGGKTPMYIHMKDRQPFAFAGLWERWGEDDLLTCTIITTEPNSLMRKIHHRMPVILKPEDYTAWLSRDYQDEVGLKALLEPYDADAMTAYAVGKAVNSPANDSADLLEPIAPQ